MMAKAQDQAGLVGMMGRARCKGGELLVWARQGGGDSRASLHEAPSEEARSTKNRDCHRTLTAMNETK